MFKKILVFIFFNLITLCNFGCDKIKTWAAREFRQGSLADGVTRLSTIYLSIILNEVTKVLQENEKSILKNYYRTAVNDPKQYGRGKTTLQVADVVIKHSGKKVWDDCIGRKFFWDGQVNIITAIQTIKGRLMNNKKMPAIPDPGSVKIDIHVKVEDLVIKIEGLKEYLHLKEGEIKYRAIPRLAQIQTEGPSKGIRGAPTGDLRFENVRFLNIKGTLHSSVVTTPIEIHDSNLLFQLGRGENGDENLLLGQINFMDFERPVPLDGLGLDPNYDRKKHIDTFICDPELNGKLSYKTDPYVFEKNYSASKSALILQALGFLAGEMENNSDCGMANPDVLRSTKFVRKGDGFGQSINNVQNCPLKFENHLAMVDRLGQAFFLNGSAKIVSGTKKVDGFLPLYPKGLNKAVALYEDALSRQGYTPEMFEKPILAVPNRKQPVEVFLEADFSNFSISTKCLKKGDIKNPNHCIHNEKGLGYDKFTISVGRSSGSFRPVLAKDFSQANGLCMKQVPIMEGSLVLENIKATLDSEGKSIRTMASGKVNVVSGRIGDRENELKGYLHLNGYRKDFKQAKNDFVPLDPNYELFAQSFLSGTRIKIPKDDQDCNLEMALKGNIARLLTLNAGSLLNVASSNEVDGSLQSFEAFKNIKLEKNNTMEVMRTSFPSVLRLQDDSLTPPIKQIDGLGQVISSKGTLQGINGIYRRKGKPMVPRGFLGKLFAGGKAFILRTREAIIRPTMADSTRIKVGARLKDFSTKVYRPHENIPLPHLVVSSGSLVVEANPLMGLDKRTKKGRYPSYSIPTPIVKFERISADNVMAAFQVGEAQVPVYIEKAVLHAFNGRFYGEGNYVGGDISFSFAKDFNEDLKGQTYTFHISKIPLDPNYDQERFNESYRNMDKNLDDVLPWE